MVTAEEIAAVPIFAALGEAERERLSRAAADISLVPGEYAAAEGSERALFALLEGRIEAVKLTDGIERVIGERRPGDVRRGSITLGTVFPVGFRAAEASRVLRLDAHDYHVVAAAAPDVAKEVGRLAAHRIGGVHGLQGIAADPPPPRAIAVGSRLGPCGRGISGASSTATRSRSRGSRPTPPTPSRRGAARCPRRTSGRRSERSTAGLTRPTTAGWPSFVGPTTEPAASEYDTVIVGGGLGRRRGRLRRVGGAADDRRRARGPRGQAGTSSRIENYLGFPSGVSGDELASRALQQARSSGPRSSSRG